MRMKMKRMIASCLCMVLIAGMLPLPVCAEGREAGEEQVFEEASELAEAEADADTDLPEEEPDGDGTVFKVVVHPGEHAYGAPIAFELGDVRPTNTWESAKNGEFYLTDEGAVAFKLPDDYCPESLFPVNGDYIFDGWEAGDFYDTDGHEGYILGTETLVFTAKWKSAELDRWIYIENASKRECKLTDYKTGDIWDGYSKADTINKLYIPSKINGMEVVDCTISLKSFPNLDTLVFYEDCAIKDMISCKDTPLRNIHVASKNGGIIRRNCLPDSIETIPSGTFVNTRIAKLSMPNVGWLASHYSGCFDGCSYLSTLTLGKAAAIEEGALSYIGSSCVVHYPGPVSSILWNASRFSPDLRIECNDGSCGWCGSNEDDHNYLHWIMDNDGKLIIDCFGSDKNLYEEYKEYLTLQRGYWDKTKVTSVEIKAGKLIALAGFFGCGTLKSVVLPSSLNTISGYAFKDCVSLENIVLPCDLKHIHAEAFSNCKRLSEVLLPQSIKSIDSNVFDGCSSLKDIYYDGAQVSWNQIDKNEKWKEGTLPDLQVHWRCDVSFDTQGHGTAPAAQEGLWSNEDKVADPGYLSEEGFVFTGWYIDEDCTQAWDFNDHVEDSMTLYAGWKVKTNPTYTVIVENGSGDREYEEGESVTIVADAPAEGKLFDRWTGTEGLTFTAGSAESATATFTMPARKVTVKASYKDKEALSPVVTIAGWTYGETPNAPTLSGNAGNGAVTYEYYTDAACSVKTTAADNAADKTGGVPKNAGTYYLKATIAETETYASSEAVAEFVIEKAEDPALISEEARVSKGGRTIDLSPCVSAAEGAVSFSIGTDQTGGGCTVTKEGLFTSGEKSGSCNVTVTVAESLNHKEKTGTIMVNVIDKEAATVSIAEGDRLEKRWGDEGFTLHVSVTDPGEAEGILSFTGSDTEVAAVDGNGAVTIKAAGSCVITVRYESDTAYGEATLTLVVLQKTLGDPQLEISRTYLYTDEISDYYDMKELLPADAGEVSCDIPSLSGSAVYKEAPAVKDAVLTYTLGKGDTPAEGTIKVKARGRNYSNEFTLIVHVRQQIVAFFEKMGQDHELRTFKDLKTGESFTLVPMFIEGSVLNQRVVWMSSNPDVATVTQDGKVSAKAAGSTVISVLSEEKPDSIASCEVTVREPASAVSLDRKKGNLGIGESVTLTAQVLPFTAEQKLKWSADNGNVKLVVSEDTMSVSVTGVTAGKAKVTAEAADGSGKKAACSFDIGNPVSDFTITAKGDATEVQAGKSLAMQVKWSAGTPKNTDVIWSLSAGDGNVSYIASISDKGVLNGISAGKVTVTAVSAADPGKKAEATIKVTAPVQSGPELTAISLMNGDALKEKGLSKGKSFALKTKLTLSGEGKAAADAVAWVSSDSSIATVSQKGVVKALSAGEVTITAFPRYAADISSAPKAEVTFTVTAPVKSVKIDKKKMTLGTQEGSEYGKITVVSVLPADASDAAVEWKADNANVQLAAIPADGSAKDGSFAEAGKSVTTKAGEALAVKALMPGVTKLSGVTTDGSKKKVSCSVVIRGQVSGLALQASAGKNGVNDVTLADDGATDAVEYSSNMNAGGGMSLKVLVDINGISATDAAAKKSYKLYKKYTDASVSFRSSDTSVLTVNNKGKISVKKDAAGKSAVVYVQSADGKYTAAVTVTVK